MSLNTTTYWSLPAPPATQKLYTSQWQNAHYWDQWFFFNLVYSASQPPQASSQVAAPGVPVARKKPLPPAEQRVKFDSSEEVVKTKESTAPVEVKDEGGVETGSFPSTSGQRRRLPSKRQIFQSAAKRAREHQLRHKDTKRVNQAPGKAVVSAEPIWKRRGANPIPSLALHPIIRGDIPWLERIAEEDDQLEIVQDSEWRAIKPGYFEVHSDQDVADGVVIKPPTYPAWYQVPNAYCTVAAQLPIGCAALIQGAIDEGYDLNTLITTMGNAIAKHCKSYYKLKRGWQDIVVLARQQSWQGAAAIYAARKLFQQAITVKVFIADERDNVGYSRGNDEEDKFVAEGGQIFRDLQFLVWQKFRLAVVALEDQYSGRKTTLPLYGDILQHSMVVLVDPPILKCTYTTALQLATQGMYNICQKTTILTPILPKPFIPDFFVSQLVVDCGIAKSTQESVGIPLTIFPREFRAIGDEPQKHQPECEWVFPCEYQVKGSRLYFYNEGVMDC